MKRKKNNRIIKISPKNYIRNHIRKLPIFQCWVDSNWEKTKMCNILVTRKHYNDDITIGFYLVDLGCLGIKDTHYKYKISEDEYFHYITEFSENQEFELIDYVLAHNIIYSALEYAEDLGFKPHKDFDDITKYILENDDENIELIDIECGENGKPLYISGPYDSIAFQNKVINTLLDNVGEDNFNFIAYSGNNGEENDDDENYEDYGEYEDDENYDDEEYDDDQKGVFHIFEHLSSFNVDEFQLNTSTDKWYLEKIENLKNIDFDEFEKVILLTLAYIIHFSEEVNTDKIVKQVIGDFNLADVSNQPPSIFIENVNPEIKQEIIQYFNKTFVQKPKKFANSLLKKIKKAHGKIPIFHFIKYVFSEKKSQKHLENFLNSIDESNKEQAIVKLMTKLKLEKSLINNPHDSIPIYTLNDFFDKNEQITTEELLQFLILSLKNGVIGQDFSYKHALFKILIDIKETPNIALDVESHLFLYVLANIKAVGEKLSETEKKN